MHRPIVLSVKSYRGSDRAKAASYRAELQLARQIESYLNQRLSREPEGNVIEFDYWTMAADLQVDKSTVKRVLFANGGGSNGITLRA